MIYVFYHAGCKDGFAAAYAAWKYFGENGSDYVKYVAVHYSDAPPKIEGASDIYVLDFHFSKDVTELMAAKCEGQVYVIDHHETAAHRLKDVSPEVNVHIDLEHSGAYLAWHFFHKETPPPKWLLSIEDRDLWKFEMQYTEEVCLAIDSYPMTFEVWDTFNFPALYREGKVQLRLVDKIVSSMVNSAHIVRIGKHRVPAVNTGTFISKVGNELCKKYNTYPFAACYFDKENVRVWSLRSIGEFNVREVAEQYGGGGHQNAAGFHETISRRREESS